jgi:NitT/TauT family transport system ATP-binding protein
VARATEQNAQYAVNADCDHNADKGSATRARFLPSPHRTSTENDRRAAVTVIALRHATKRFAGAGGRPHTAVRDLNLTVEAGEFVAVVGPTGCGKSTTLSLVSGLEPASDGEVEVDGRPVRGIPEGVGYMFQTDAVMPWRSVLDNVAAGPRYRGADKEEARKQAMVWVERVGLAKFAKYYPHQLSGGMRKRVALAQTLVNEPRIMLMDEPFSALDVQTRALMQDELLRLWQGTGAAVVFVTHDLEEAIALADRVVVMTSSPATVKAEFAVPLPRPRDVEEIRMTPAFVAAYREIWDSLREEVARSREEASRAGLA